MSNILDRSSPVPKVIGTNVTKAFFENLGVDAGSVVDAEITVSLGWSGDKARGFFNHVSIGGGGKEKGFGIIPNDHPTAEAIIRKALIARGARSALGIAKHHAHKNS
ncbi:MAG: hypothetical protein AAF569_05730 [Pseudomonadota bacterium]